MSHAVALHDMFRFYHEYRHSAVYLGSNPHTPARHKINTLVLIQYSIPFTK